MTRPRPILRPRYDKRIFPTEAEEHASLIKALERVKAKRRQTEDAES